MSSGIGDTRRDYSWPLYSIIAEICDRAGVPPDALDFFSLNSYVDGFSMTCENPAYTGLQELSKVFLFDPSNYGGVLHFKTRGSDVVATIPIEDMIDDGEAIETLTKKDSISIPRVYHLKYYDTDGNLTTDMQTSDRSVDNRSKSEQTVSTTVILNTDDALRSAIINHKIAAEEQRGEYNFSLPDSYIYLTVGDCVTVEGYRLRIIEIEHDNGFQRYKATFDRQSAYTCDAIALPIQSATPPRTTIIGTTVLQFIDSHILKDSDDKLGYYVAIAGTSTNWYGALAELSLDGGQSWIDSYEGVSETVMGVLTVGCGSADREYPDEHNSITVQMLRSDFEIQGATLSQMMSRTNLALIGDELVNFGNVNEITPGTWEIDYFLRGRKGSAITSHAAGERFVLLTRPQLIFIESELYHLNRQLTFRVTSYGRTTETAIQTVSFTGKSQIERSPEYLTAYRDGGNIVISWQGVGRVGAGVYVAMGQYFNGYRVTVNGSQQTTTDETLTVTDPGGSVTISVAQLNIITGAGPEATITI